MGPLHIGGEFTLDEGRRLSRSPSLDCRSRPWQVVGDSAVAAAQRVGSVASVIIGSNSFVTCRLLCVSEYLPSLITAANASTTLAACTLQLASAKRVTATLGCPATATPLATLARGVERIELTCRAHLGYHRARM